MLTSSREMCLPQTLVQHGHIPVGRERKRSLPKRSLGNHNMTAIVLPNTSAVPRGEWPAARHSDTCPGFLTQPSRCGTQHQCFPHTSHPPHNTGHEKTHACSFHSSSRPLWKRTFPPPAGRWPLRYFGAAALNPTQCQLFSPLLLLHHRCECQQRKG